MDKVPDRLELAKQFGAETINGDDAEAAIASVKDATQGRGVDCAMEAVGHQATVNLGFNMLRMGGLISKSCYLTGHPCDDLVDAPPCIFCTFRSKNASQSRGKLPSMKGTT